MNYTNRKKIIRTYTKHHNDYKLYKEPLAEDFFHRCAYCDTRDDIITTPFEIDHFIPRKQFENIKDYLDSDYTNLVYSCKKCNQSKGSKFSGDIYSDSPTNDLFYDPTITDYNTVFYRNENGIIMSDDPKAKNMIKELRLYRPIYALAWVVGQANETIENLERRIENTKDNKEIEALNLVKTKLCEYIYKVNKIFIANYNTKNEYNS